ncbi:MAG: alpha/beta hydrolase [Planctomycetaceae bacterium]|nr:alpha/beta hydrolase [Planctomycetaceae bacterium]
MQGAFHFLKSIIASLTLAVVAFLMRYGGHLFVQDVDDPPAGVVVTRHLGSDSDSQSAQRTQTDHRLATWNVGVVTNRVLAEPAVAAPQGLLSASSTLRHTTESLAEQAINMMYGTPESTFQFVPVSVQLNRRRGDCATSPADKANVALHPPIRCTSDAFFDDIRGLVEQSDAHDIFVFVHGFNVTLENATARAAQMAEDLPFDGVVLVFSWPSAGKATAYLSDEHQAERYFWNLSALLHRLRQSCPADTHLNLLAHSMGNRVTLRAIEALCGTIDPAGGRNSLAFERHFSGRGVASSGNSAGIVGASPAEIQRRFPSWGRWHHSRRSGSPPIDNLVLASPDVAAADFRQSINNLRHACGRIVVYASDSDYALKASRRVHGGYRAGDSRAQLNIDGVHVVRVTGVSLHDPLGHSFYGTNTRVLDQLAALFRPQPQLTTLPAQPLH